MVLRKKIAQCKVKNNVACLKQKNKLAILALKRKEKRAQEVKNHLKIEASVKLLNVQLAEKSA